jgi:hypothetical protein
LITEAGDPERTAERGIRERGAKDQALGRSRGGLTSGIHMLADALGRPLRFIITAGQIGNITQAPATSGGRSAMPCRRRG